MNEFEALKKLKKRQGLTYQQIADGLGVHVQTVKNWFLGVYKPSPLARERIQIFLKRRRKR